MQDPTDSSPSGPVIVSNPVAQLPSALSGTPNALLASGAADLTYVSVPPGRFADGESLVITRRATGASVKVAMVNGGFDPVPVAASAGDTLDLEIQLRGVVTPLRLVATVPAARRPVIVRTYPPPKKRDVPLNASILVVFSEPINASTLTRSTATLMRGTETVSGQVDLVDPPHLTATFQPVAPLDPGTTYQLVISRAVQDLDGDSLDGSVAVEFTTVEQTATQLTFTLQPSNMGVGLAITPHVQVTARDGSGRVATDFRGGVTIEIGSNPGGALLLGSTTATAVEGVATFFDLGLDQTGNGYTLVAAAPDLRGATSAPFDITPVGPVAGRIAYVTGGSIDVVNADGSNWRRLLLTGMPWPDRLAWSPDGARIAFDNSTSIRVMNADGSGVMTLFDRGTTYTSDAAWSRDGARIAFTGTTPLGSLGIFVMKADGSEVTQLTNDADFGPFDDGTGNLITGSDQWPTWSPDGTKIAFMRFFADRAPDGLGPGIFVMNVDGSGVKRLVSENNARHPAWSPDGTRIAFARFGTQACQGGSILVMNADGSGVTTVTCLQTEASPGSPTWSPDGARIAFDRDGNKIVVMYADGSGLRLLPVGVYRPAWSPVP